MVEALQPTRSASAGWRGRLSLGFDGDSGRTTLRSRKHEGPLVVQRPFYPEGDVCHVYLLHPPAGIVGGDTLELSVRAERNARVLLTTPGATKCYRSEQRVAKQSQRIHVSGHSRVEWLPQETILFDGAHMALTTHVLLDETSDFAGWDIVCLGRPASGSRFDTGAFTQRFEIWRGENPLWIEHGRVEGGSDALRGPWGWAGHSVAGTFMCTARDTEGVVSALREAMLGTEAVVAFTAMDGVVVARYLGDSAQDARRLLSAVWAEVRKRVWSETPCAPRIWAT